MRRKSQEQLKKTNDIIAIANIIGLVKADKFKEAIEVSIKRGFSPEEFGIIANMTDCKAEDIYKKVFG